MWSMGVLRRRVCWKEGDVELLVVVLLLVVDEVVDGATLAKGRKLRQRRACLHTSHA